jgi:hypothetical protein
MKITRIIIISMLISACNAHPSTNLVVNGDAELPLSDSTPHGWKNVLGHWKEVEGDSASHGYAWAEEGKQHFFEGQDELGVMEQDIDVRSYATAIDAHKQQGIFSGYVSAFPQSPADQSRIVVSCLADTLGKPLYVYNSDTISYSYPAATLPVREAPAQRVQLPVTWMACPKNSRYPKAFSRSV